MIKNEFIKNIQKTATQNIEKLYEIIDKVIEIVQEHYSGSQISYNDVQNTFLVNVNDNSAITITTTISSVEINITSNKKVIINVRLTANDEYAETRARLSEAEKDLFDSFLWSLNNLTIVNDSDSDSDKNNNVASDGTVVEEVK